MKKRKKRRSYVYDKRDRSAIIRGLSVVAKMSASQKFLERLGNVAIKKT
jgi:hypothetical protein